MSEKNGNLFITSPERVQSLFIYCLEKPKTLTDFSIIFKLQPSLYYRNNFLETLVSRGVFRLEYIGRKPYLYSLFGDEFREYYRQILQISPMPREFRTAFLEDEDKMISFFDSELFREFWKDDVVKLFTKNDFKKPDFLLARFINFISYPLSIHGVLTLKKNLDFESIKPLVASQLYFILKQFGITIHPEFFIYLENYFTKERFEKTTFLKETELYKVNIKITKPFLDKALSIFGKSLAKFIKDLKIE